MNSDDKKKIPPAVFSADPREELEDELSQRPYDLNTRVDVGSDESMDASDPPVTSRPGEPDEPPPSSGFPDKS
jgi:hypothetical protein